LVACGAATTVLAPGAAHALLADGGPELAKQMRAEARSVALVHDENEKFVWPVPEDITTYFDGGHAGLDIDGEAGDKIVASRSGRVTFAGDDGDGYGVKVLIRHAGGYETLYSHLSTIAVDLGPIRRGDLVGTVGCTGSCTGDHLHFEIHENGAAIDPLNLLP
jgi:murein DD-endopeptidase MepM/ murein hydrolase activator NlpD